MVSCGVSHRNGSDPVFLWLRHRPVATALIRSLTWEPPHAMGVALEKTKRQKKKKKKERKKRKEIIQIPCIIYPLSPKVALTKL